MRKKECVKPGEGIIGDNCELLTNGWGVEGWRGGGVDGVQLVFVV